MHKNNLIEIEKSLDQLIENIKLENYFLKQKNYHSKHKIVSENLDLIKNMFKINPTFALKTILPEYKILSNQNVLYEEIIWKYVYKNFNSNYENIILILISELRLYLIKNSKHIGQKKDLYYKIEIETVINKLRNDNLNTEDIFSILHILYENCPSELKRKYKFNEEQNDYFINDKKIINIFRELYNVMKINI